MTFFYAHIGRRRGDGRGLTGKTPTDMIAGNVPTARPRAIIEATGQDRRWRGVAAGVVAAGVVAPVFRRTLNYTEQ